MFDQLGDEKFTIDSEKYTVAKKPHISDCTFENPIFERQYQDCFYQQINVQNADFEVVVPKQQSGEIKPTIKEESQQNKVSAANDSQFIKQIDQSKDIQQRTINQRNLQSQSTRHRNNQQSIQNTTRVQKSTEDQINLQFKASIHKSKQYRAQSIDRIQNSSSVQSSVNKKHRYSGSVNTDINMKDEIELNTYRNNQSKSNNINFKQNSDTLQCVGSRHTEQLQDNNTFKVRQEGNSDEQMMNCQTNIEADNVGDLQLQAGLKSLRIPSMKSINHFDNKIGLLSTQQNEKLGQNQEQQQTMIDQYGTGYDYQSKQLTDKELDSSLQNATSTYSKNKPLTTSSDLTENQQTWKLLNNAAKMQFPVPQHEAYDTEQQQKQIFPSNNLNPQQQQQQQSQQETHSQAQIPYSSVKQTAHSVGTSRKNANVTIKQRYGGNIDQLQQDIEEYQRLDMISKFLPDQNTRQREERRSASPDKTKSNSQFFHQFINTPKNLQKIQQQLKGASQIPASIQQNMAEKLVQEPRKSSRIQLRQALQNQYHYIQDGKTNDYIFYNDKTKFDGVSPKSKDQPKNQDLSQQILKQINSPTIYFKEDKAQEVINRQLSQSPVRSQKSDRLRNIQNSKGHVVHFQELQQMQITQIKSKTGIDSDLNDVNKNLTPRSLATQKQNKIYSPRLQQRKATQSKTYNEEDKNKQVSPEIASKKFSEERGQLVNVLKDVEQKQDEHKREESGKKPFTNQHVKRDTASQQGYSKKINDKQQGQNIHQPLQVYKSPVLHQNQRKSRSEDSRSTQIQKDGKHNQEINRQGSPTNRKQAPQNQVQSQYGLRQRRLQNEEQVLEDNSPDRKVSVSQIQIKKYDLEKPEVGKDVYNSSKIKSINKYNQFASIDKKIDINNKQKQKFAISGNTYQERHDKPEASLKRSHISRENSEQIHKHVKLNANESKKQQMEAKLKFGEISVNGKIVQKSQQPVNNNIQHRKPSQKDLSKPQIQNPQNISSNGLDIVKGQKNDTQLQQIDTLNQQNILFQFVSNQLKATQMVQQETQRQYQEQQQQQQKAKEQIMRLVQNPQLMTQKEGQDTLSLYKQQYDQSQNNSQQLLQQIYQIQQHLQAQNLQKLQQQAQQPQLNTQQLLMQLLQLQNNNQQQAQQQQQQTQNLNLGLFLQQQQAQFQQIQNLYNHQNLNQNNQGVQGQVPQVLLNQNFQFTTNPGIVQMQGIDNKQATYIQMQQILQQQQDQMKQTFAKQSLELLQRQQQQQQQQQYFNNNQAQNLGLGNDRKNILSVPYLNMQNVGQTNQGQIAFVNPTQENKQSTTENFQQNSQLKQLLRNNLQQNQTGYVWDLSKLTQQK